MQMLKEEDDDDDDDNIHNHETTERKNIGHDNVEEEPATDDVTTGEEKDDKEEVEPSIADTLEEDGCYIDDMGSSTFHEVMNKYETSWLDSSVRQTTNNNITTEKDEDELSLDTIKSNNIGAKKRKVEAKTDNKKQRKIQPPPQSNYPLSQCYSLRSRSLMVEKDENTNTNTNTMKLMEATSITLKYLHLHQHQHTPPPVMDSAEKEKELLKQNYLIFIPNSSSIGPGTVKTNKPKKRKLVQHEKNNEEFQLILSDLCMVSNFD